jgi:hypothetical protein
MDVEAKGTASDKISDIEWYMATPSWDHDVACGCRSYVFKFQVANFFEETWTCKPSE